LTRALAGIPAELTAYGYACGPPRYDEAVYGFSQLIAKPSTHDKSD